ncbi:MAG: ThuA domain-containing protein [Verrucomicrobiota bacterium]
MRPHSNCFLRSLASRALALSATICVGLSIALAESGADEKARDAEVGPIRVLFLGHKAENHQASRHYPILTKALGREAIYFDYVTDTEEAFSNFSHLQRYDAVLIYANHKTIEQSHWRNLKRFVEEGGGFVPVHCASWCFQNILEYDDVVGARFLAHGAAVFSPRNLKGASDHPLLADLPTFEASDESYYHSDHHPEGRTVLQVRDVLDHDRVITEPEPWTWIREQGKGRVFYTASGHDERVWNLPAFHELLRRGILWSVGESRFAGWETFLKPGKTQAREIFSTRSTSIKA